MGVSLKTKPRAPEDDALEIMPANWNSVMTFLDVQTQWDISVGMAGLIWRGLRYSDVMHVLDDTGAAPGVFADIRVMEAAALPILNSAAD